MQISKAVKEDLQKILTLQKICYKETETRYEDYELPPMTETVENMQRIFPETCFFKAVIENDIVGSIRAYDKDGTCYIGRVIVHPDHQNKGIGKQLMLEIEKQYPQIKRFELFTGNKDEKNLYFYNKLGYKEFKREKHPSGYFLVYMEKNIV